MISGERMALPISGVFLAALLVAATVGYLAAASQVILLVLVGGTSIAILAITARISVLVPLTTAFLVLGSTSFLWQSSAILIAKLAVMGALGGVSITWLAGRGPVPQSKAFHLSFLGLIGFALLSSLYSPSPVNSVIHAASLLMLWLAAMVVVPGSCREPSDFLAIFRRVGLVAALTVVAGVLVTAVGVVGVHSIGRFSGVLANPNTLGYFIAPILPGLVLILALETKERKRLGLILMISVLGLGLLLSGSRGGMLAAFAGIFAGLAISRDARRKVWRVAVVGVLVGATLLSLNQPIRPEVAGQEGVFEIGTGSKRLDAWSDAFRLIAEEPLRGHGFATTPVLLTSLRDRDSYGFSRLHNSYLETAFELGWPGAAFLLLLAGSGLLAARKVARAGGIQHVMGCALFAGITGGMVEAVFETGLISAGGLLAFHFWLLVGVAHAFNRRRREHFPHRATSDSTSLGFAYRGTPSDGG